MPKQSDRNLLYDAEVAGSGGDVDEIVAQALAEAEAGPGTYGGGPILKTELLAPHPQLLELLAQRATQPALITS
jgi:hypothetical protein|eukprot:COSAG01_NODE_2031_length_8555_cov_4.407778_9_plen_74_part_00